MSEEGITIEDIVKSVDIFKNGGWIDNRVPSKWHYEEVDDICECCGTNSGKIKVQIVDKYKIVKEYIHPGDYNPDCLVLHSDVMNSLMDDIK